MILKLNWHRLMESTDEIDAMTVLNEFLSLPIATKALPIAIEYPDNSLNTVDRDLALPIGTSTPPIGI